MAAFDTDNRHYRVDIDTPEDIERFERECAAMGMLSSHPNIVTIYDVGEAEGLAYIAMEYLPGATLRDLMHRRPMPLDLTLDTVTVTEPPSASMMR